MDGTKTTLWAAWDQPTLVGSKIQEPVWAEGGEEIAPSCAAFWGIRHNLDHELSSSFPLACALTYLFSDPGLLSGPGWG